MLVRVMTDSVEISGYVNAVERNSKPLFSRIGRFVERILKGAFSSALQRNDDVYLLLNHDSTRVLGSQKQGNLELTEDNIGLYARAVVTDPEVIEDARNGRLVGWSFGFYDTPDGVVNGIDEDTGLPLRKLRDLDLREVSILDSTKSPAYEGTLIMARADEDALYCGETFLDEIEVRDIMVGIMVIIVSLVLLCRLCVRSLRMLAIRCLHLFIGMFVLLSVECSMISLMVKTLQW